MIAFTLIFIFKRPSKDSSPPKYFGLVCLLSVFSSLLWNKFLSENLIGIFRGIGFIFNIPVSYLGYAFISIGNALPDGLATIALAKIGEAKMGITAGLAANLFALLIGFDVSTLIALISKKS